MKSDLTRRKDGFYILKHKTKKGKKDDCVKCGQNPKNHDVGLLYRYTADDMNLVKEYIEQNLREYTSHTSMKPNWCEECKALIDYTVEIDIDKTLGYNAKTD